jgi:hypothetical protein
MKKGRRRLCLGELLLKLGFPALKLDYLCLNPFRRSHVQAIIVAIDQYAEAATGNREYFLNNPTQLVVVESRRRSVGKLHGRCTAAERHSECVRHE